MKFDTLKQAFLTKNPTGSIEKCTAIANSGYSTGVLVRFSESGKEYRYTGTYFDVAKKLQLSPSTPSESRQRAYKRVLNAFRRNEEAVAGYYLAADLREGGVEFVHIDDLGTDEWGRDLFLHRLQTEQERAVSLAWRGA